MAILGPIIKINNDDYNLSTHPLTINTTENGEAKQIVFNGAEAKEINVPNINDFKYSNDTPTVIEVGGVKPGSHFDGKTIIEVLDMLFYPYVAPVMSNLTLSGVPAATYEYGTKKTVSTVVPSFKKGSKAITSIKIGTTNGGSELYEGNSATSGSAITLTNSKTFDGNTGGTIYCTISDGDNSSVAQASIAYTYYGYSALTTDGTAPSSGATKHSNANAEDDYSYSSGQYLWLYSRDSGKKIQQHISGTWADVDTFGGSKISLTLASGITADYYAYRTDKFTADGSARYKLA
jgi:hypothetical protein